MDEHEIRSSKEIKDLWGKKDIIQTLKGRKMSWLGQVWKLRGKIKKTGNQKRLLCRPKKRWVDEPNQSSRIFGADSPEELANVREKWRKIIGAVMANNEKWPIKVEGKDFELN